jgi:meiotically up-regulated gene 157 (Mug157) protein
VNGKIPQDFHSFQYLKKLKEIENIMAENKDNNERKAQIAAINKHIREGINQWADIMLMADADQWAYELRYFPRDLMNATIIYQHVASSIGIHAGRHRHAHRLASVTRCAD